MSGGGEKPEMFQEGVGVCLQDSWVEGVRRLDFWNHIGNPFVCIIYLGGRLPGSDGPLGGSTTVWTAALLG